MSNIEITIVASTNDVDKLPKLIKVLMEEYDEVTIKLKKDEPDEKVERSHLPVAVAERLRKGKFHEALALYHTYSPGVPFKDAKEFLLDDDAWQQGPEEPGYDAWEGGEMPVPKLVIVEALLRGGVTVDGCGEVFIWSHGGDVTKDQEIVGYKVIGW